MTKNPRLPLILLSTATVLLVVLLFARLTSESGVGSSWFVATGVVALGWFATLRRRDRGT
jgi:hypothetical protein